MHTTQTSLLWAVRDPKNDSAWISFYRLYAGLIRHFVRRIGLPDAEADDVTQEALVLAHKSLCDGVYDPARGRFRAWLFGIARRRALAAIRARQRRTRAQWTSDDGGVDLLDRLEERQTEDAHRRVWDQEWRYALLEEALRHVRASVGEKAIKVFQLHAIARWPADKVAAELGIATPSVYVYKHRVLHALREWLTRFEDDGEAAPPEAPP